MPRFPISVVPPVLTATPTVRSCSRVEPAGTSRRRFHPDTPASAAGYFELDLGDERELPREFFLRELLALQLDDDEALLALIREYGLPYIDPRKRLFFPPGEQVLAAYDAYSEALGTIFSLEVPRYTLRLLRACVRHWVASEKDASVLDAWATEGFHWGDDEVGPWMAWANLITEAAGAFTFRLLARDETGYGNASPTPGLASCIAMQLLDAIAEDYGVRYCQNETCGRPFVRQLGGAIDGQFRKHGVLYCSPACARAQGARAWRRKDALRKRNSGKDT